jgi:hypothetical protein
MATDKIHADIHFVYPYPRAKYQTRIRVRYPPWVENCARILYVRVLDTRGHVRLPTRQGLRRGTLSTGGARGRGLGRQCGEQGSPTAVAPPRWMEEDRRKGGAVAAHKTGGGGRAGAARRPHWVSPRPPNGGGGSGTPPAVCAAAPGDRGERGAVRRAVGGAGSGAPAAVGRREILRVTGRTAHREELRRRGRCLGRWTGRRA